MLFDKIAFKSLILSTLCSFMFPLFIFVATNKLMVFIMWFLGHWYWQSRINSKSAVAKLIGKNKRSLGFGLFEGVFGLCWFLEVWFWDYSVSSH